MFFSAHPMAAPPDEARVWIGVYDAPDPPPPSIEVEGVDAPVAALAGFTPIRDGSFAPDGRALNHRGIWRVRGLQPGADHRAEIRVGDQVRRLRLRTLPERLPGALDGRFNILLSSCYSQPEDGSGLLGTVASQVKPRPDLTLLLGDQVYGDLPVDEDLPPDDDGIARVLGAKYRRNFAESQWGMAGLGPLLARAPVACIADDHEYWNNYPFRQVQLPKTWLAEGRAQWARIARALYEDYQLQGTAGGAQRITVDPLQLLLLDLRSDRDARFEQLASNDTMAEVRAWAQGLHDARAAGRPAFGLLASGQALFVRAADERHRTDEDAEMANYGQFGAELVPLLERLSDAGIPVLYVTGDVHWSRVSEAEDVRTGQVSMVEVIVSPSRLIRVPVVDAAKEAANRVQGWFGAAAPWPRHSPPELLPERLRELGRLRLQCDLEHQRHYAQPGDRIAMLSVWRAGTGIEFSITYFAVTDDPDLALPQSTPVYSLRNLA